MHAHHVPLITFLPKDFLVELCKSRQHNTELMYFAADADKKDSAAGKFQMLEVF